jgi:hypothetical protein
MLELFTTKPVFQGDNEIHQLDVIYKIFGTPTTERWPGLTNLPWYELVKPTDSIPNRFRELFASYVIYLSLPRYLLNLLNLPSGGCLLPPWTWPRSYSRTIPSIE